MQLKFNQEKSIRQSIASRFIKLILIVLIIVIAIFLVEKVNFPAPEKNFKKDITNEIIKLK